MSVKSSGLLLALLLSSVTAFAHDPDHPDELHFSHPLVVESPSPDTKIRFDYFDYDIKNGVDAREHTPRVEFEYAFRPSFSIEADVPYTFRRVTRNAAGPEHLDSIELALKFARPMSTGSLAPESAFR